MQALGFCVLFLMILYQVTTLPTGLVSKDKGTSSFQECPGEGFGSVSIQLDYGPTTGIRLKGVFYPPSGRLCIQGFTRKNVQIYFMDDRTFVLRQMDFTRVQTFEGKYDGSISWTLLPPTEPEEGRIQLRISGKMGGYLVNYTGLYTFHQLGHAVNNASVAGPLHSAFEKNSSDVLFSRN